MKKKLVFKRLVGKKLLDSKVTEHIEYVKERILTDGRVRGGWKVATHDFSVEEVDVEVPTGVFNAEGQPIVQKKTHAYTFQLDVFNRPKKGRREDVVAKEYEAIVQLSAKALKSKDWELVSNEDLPADTEVPETLEEKEEREKREARAAARKAKEAGQVLVEVPTEEPKVEPVEV